jgi:hypothetical protein
MSAQWQAYIPFAHSIDVAVEEIGNTIAREVVPLSRDQRIVLDALLYALAYDAAGMRGEPE